MSHHHSYHYHYELNGKKLLVSVILNFSITVIQIAGGVVSNSLSLLSDAFHNLGDSASLFVAYFANRIGCKQPDRKNTFGYKRIEILAAFVNSAVLVGICIFLFVEAIQRLLHPQWIHSKIMLFVASFGLIANLLSVVLLNRDKDKSLNIKAAYLHLLGDTISSFAIIAGGIFIWKFKIYWLDSLLTLGLSLYILKHAYGLLKDSVKILIQSTPKNIDPEDVKEHLEQIDEVDNVHHLHLWQLSDNQIHLESHINLDDDYNISQTNRLIEEIKEILYQNFYINHVTLQFEYNCCENRSLIINNMVSIK